MSSLTISITETALRSPDSFSATVSQRIFGAPGCRSLRKSNARSASSARSAAA